jgi:hypothetical protein
MAIPMFDDECNIALIDFFATFSQSRLCKKAPAVRCQPGPSLRPSSEQRRILLNLT